jgi:probable selenium-dependent hydroxylase accessory protein YqeC
MYKLKYKIWIDQDGKAFGEGPYKLLQGIKDTGSLSKSAKALNMSYSQAHTMMKNLSNKLGFPLIKSKTGGLGGGMTEITPEAQGLLDLYGNFYRDCEQALEELFYEYFLANKEVLQENNLINAFGIGEQGIIAFVGGGGKTSLMWRLAKELAKKNKKVLVTTTTRIMPPTVESNHFFADSDLNKVIVNIQKKLKNGQIFTLGKEFKGEKLVGIDIAWIDKLSGFVDYILVEADGARRKPFKAPAEHEPVIPQDTTTVVSVVGIDALEKELTDENVFRSELISDISGTPVGEKINVGTIASVMVSDKGSRKNVPKHARWVVCINKVDDLEQLQSADMVAKYILAKQPFVPVIATCMKSENIVVGRWQN